jgi:O-antigen ligase
MNIVNEIIEIKTKISQLETKPNIVNYENYEFWDYSYTLKPTGIYNIKNVTTDNDFIDWNNGYNPIITTLGNPNFAAAVMAIMGVISFSSIFNSDFKPSSRIFAVILVLMLVFAIYRSNARQGLLSIALGSGVFFIIWIWGKNKKLGLATLVPGFIVMTFSVLGMLQVGPLQQYLYKSSVSVRGYYWRAGLEMLSSHPFFGVGIDRYGSYFKQYREVDYPLNVGFQLTSSNAHNTFIQFFDFYIEITKN